MSHSINGINFYDFRREAITRMSRKLSILDLASALGHRYLRSLQIYYKDRVYEVADML
jgi:integrase